MAELSVISDLSIVYLIFGTQKINKYSQTLYVQLFCVGQRAFFGNKLQTSANNSTLLCYLKKNHYSANIRGRIVGWIVGR